MNPQNNRTILLVEDDRTLRRQLKWAFDDLQVREAGDRKTALTAVKKESPAVVLLDLGLPPDPDGPTEGMATLEDILATAPDTKVIVLTGQQEREHALHSIAKGAYDHCEKPFDTEVLRVIVDRAFRIHDLEHENRELRAKSGSTEVPGLTACSREMREVCRQIHTFARTGVSVLILGESGTGKEILARGLHTLSERTGEFVAINCAAIPEHLIEAELFGYEKGSFTGAHKTTIGRIEQAHNGTLLLDEIGDLPLLLQAKLLRVLQEQKVDRIGGRRSIPLNLRVVSSTNKNIEDMVANGTFREDLYYRLGEIAVRVPPLRERPDDAPLIAKAFLESWSREYGLTHRSLSSDALAAISRHDWPGNVRELQSLLKRAALSSDGTVTANDLGLSHTGAGNIPTLGEARRDAELDALRRALARSGGNVTEVARLLDVSRPRVYDLMREHGLKT